MKKTVTFSGTPGVLVALIIVGLGALRFFTVGASDDRDLREAVLAELTNRMGGAVGRELAKRDRADEKLAAKLAEMANVDKIEIHSLKMSKPLIPSSKSDIVVLVDYSLPGGEPTKEYWKFEYSVIGGYRYKRETTAASYYTNF